MCEVIIDGEQSTFNENSMYGFGFSWYAIAMDRPHFLAQTANLFKTHPVVALLGPRQCGKTTLARQLAADDPNRANYFDLEDPTDLARLESPKLALEPLSGLIVIDEVQR